MANLVVGDVGCTFNDICNILRRTTACEANFNNLRKLARDLGVRNEVVNKHISATQADMSSCENAFHDIIVHWRSSGPDYTRHLPVLIDALRNNGELGPLADAMEAEYGIIT